MVQRNTVRVAAVIAGLLCCSIRTAELDPALAQALSQAAIIRSWQIHIPGYPKAYNPSLIPYKNGYLLSFRVRDKFLLGRRGEANRENSSQIGLVQLDKGFNILKDTIQLLKIKSYSSELSYTAEDARLLTVGDRIFLFFNDVPFTSGVEGFAMYFAELMEKKGQFVLKDRAKLLWYPFSAVNEKNWSPFVSGGKIYLIYSDQPRVILELDATSGICSQVAQTVSGGNWNWGGIRGGTPALLTDGLFLTFFHSSIHVGHSEKKRAFNYVMGAYLFDVDPPFSIRAITPVPLGRTEDYSEKNPHKIVFPGGMAIEGNLIHVVWGKDDCQVWVTLFDKRRLLDSLISVSR